ncbi:potassium channel family protein [Pararobbsia alpina]|uniref:potassium channel family protein n=1 Tax=Pararobbsia alpina TaxID=621374 RepID=UPI0039A68BF1
MGAGLSDSAGKHYYDAGLAFYFSATTALTIGFGDLVPIRWEGRALSIFLGLLGTVFVGVVVACVINGLQNAETH